MSALWRRLRWLYDGRPVLNRPGPGRGLRVVGWGPIPIPGEKRRLQDAEDEAREVYRVAYEAP